MLGRKVPIKLCSLQHQPSFPLPWESSQHARALAPGCAVRRAITAATVTGDPIIAARGRADGSEEVAKADGTRRRGAAKGRGAWRRAAAGAAAGRRTAARTAREAGPRHATAA